MRRKGRAKLLLSRFDRLVMWRLGESLALPARFALPVPYMLVPAQLMNFTLVWPIFWFFNQSFSDGIVQDVNPLLLIGLAIAHTRVPMVREPTECFRPGRATLLRSRLKNW